MGIVDYRTGIVNSTADLVALVRTACTDNGWTLTAGNVLHKTDAGSGKTCYVRLTAVSNIVVLLGGTGVNGSGVLTGVNLSGSTEVTIRMGQVLLPAADFPWTYHIHIYDDPDCVFVIINYNGSYYQHIEWGCSNLDIPGNGTWYSGITGRAFNSNSALWIGPRGGGSFNGSSGWPFGHSNEPQRHTGFIHHGFDGLEWSGIGTQSDTVWNYNEATVIRPVGQFLAAQPSAFNNRPVPQPAVVRVRRTEAKVSVAAVIPAMRLLRIDSLAPEEVFSFGPDHWKAYPIYFRNSDQRNGGSGVLHSGTMGFCLAVDPD